MPTALVTGSNRGIGLEWVKQLAQDGWHVYATARNLDNAPALQQLNREYDSVTPHRMDVTSNQDIAGLHGEIRSEPIDLLINNAGVYLEKGAPSLGSLRFDDWLKTIETNTLAAMRVTEAFLENVAHSSQKTVLITTSAMGSVAKLSSPGSYYYRSSKAALNIAARGLALEVQPRGIKVLIIHPGAVKTRMGGPESNITTEQSVTAMRQLIDRSTPQDSGKFFRYDGTIIEW